MSFIICTCDCVYQKDGCCQLERAVSSSGSRGAKCVYYVKASRAKAKKPKN